MVRIADASARLVTSFEEPAPYITTEELGRLAADYRALLDGATAVVLCGSLPAGLPAETYGSLTSYATGAGVPVILDAGGSALRYGAARGPALAIPDSRGNGWASMPMMSETAERVAAELMAIGAGSVVLLTEGGTHAITAKGRWHAAIRPSGLSSTAEPTLTGRRDALVAGFVPGVALGWSWPDMLRHAVALSASVTPGAEPDLDSYETLLPEVTVVGPRQ